MGASMDGAVSTGFVLPTLQLQPSTPSGPSSSRPAASPRGQGLPQGLQEQLVAAAGDRPKDSYVAPAGGGSRLALATLCVGLSCRVGLRSSRRRRAATDRARVSALRATLEKSPPVADAQLGAPHTTSASNPGQTLLDVIQFDSAVYYVEEEEEVMTLDVVRLGKLQGTLKVDYRTEDASAKAGSRYEAASGQLVFLPGEVSKQIRVDIINTDEWNTTLEFKIRLTNPQNCVLGRYLYVSRVKVIDNDCFPTNRFEDEIAKYGAGCLVENGVSDLELMVEYLKLNYSFQGVSEKTWAAVIIDQLQNLYYFLTIYLVKYIADDVLGPNPDVPLLVTGNKELTLLLVGALFLVPYALLNLLELWKSQLQIAEDSQLYLQENIFRKFTNYSEDSRSKVKESEMSLVMVQDVADIIENGYMKIFEIAKYLGKLALSSYFIVGENPDAEVPLILAALAIALFVSTNYRKSVEYNENVSDRQADIMEVVQETNQKYRLVADYYMRPQVQETLSGCTTELKNAQLPAKAANVTNDYFPGWVSTVLVVGYISVGGNAVITGTIQIGAFLATINAVKDIGDSFKDIFTACLDVGKAIGPIRKLTELMNMPTNLLLLKSINRKRRQMTKFQIAPERLQLLEAPAGDECAADYVPIRLEGVSFSYPKCVKVVKDVNLSVNQGSLVSVVGPRRGGKSTFMKLLGHVLFPTQGVYFVPSYLRILHVAEDPIILDRSLWRNLTIGRDYWRDDEFEAQRVLRICRRLGLSGSVISELEAEKDSFINCTEDENMSWQKRLSTSDTVLIHIARAFIYNPEVLVMNRPTTRLPDSVAEQVVRLITEFVRRRGVELPDSEILNRRPRTAFVSFVRMEGVQSADVVWKVEQGEVTRVSKEVVGQNLIN